MKRLYIFVAAVIDIVLLAVILKAHFANKDVQKPAVQQSSGTAATLSTAAKTEQTGTQNTQTTAQNTQTTAQNTQTTAQKTQTTAQKTQTTAQKTQTTAQKTQTTAQKTQTTAQKTQTTAGGGKKRYSTDAYATYADMGDTFLNGSSGFVWQNLNDSAVKLTDFAAVEGGWKAYIVSSPDDTEHSVTYLMNIRLSGTAEKVTVTLDWDYFYANFSGDEGHSSEPDSVYSGPWTSAGTVYAEGAGAVSLFEFDEQDGRQYGLGTVFWPDSTYGAIALVRP